MFESISNAAEKLATNVSESRRGFLARMGQAALGAAGLVAGLLALPTEAQAGISGSFCHVAGSPLGGWFMTGYCVCDQPCRTVWKPMQCHPYGAVGHTAFSFCGDHVTAARSCNC
jgi:hypothetical protein